MHKPVVPNRYLQKKWNDKENDTYFKKIWLAKPTSTIQISSKSKSVASKIKNKKKENYFTPRKFEIERDNKLLLDKLTNISLRSNLQKFLPKTLNIFKPKGTNRKMEILKISQENQALLKRLQDSNSYYDRNKWEQDFMRSNKYKSQICEFPNIESCKSKITPIDNFNITKPSFRPNTQSYEKNFNSTLNSFNKTDRNKRFFLTYGGNMGFSKINDQKNYSVDSKFNTERDNSNNSRNMLYTKICAIKGIGLCKINIYIENKKFTICVTDDNQMKYLIYIEKIEGIIHSLNKEIFKMQNLYKNYDQMIKDLELNDGLLKFSGNILIDLDYVSFNDKKEQFPIDTNTI